MRTIRIRTLCMLLASMLVSGPQRAQVSNPASADNAVASAFGWMKGDWTCSGTFPRTGKTIVTDVHIESALQETRLLLRQDDRPPNQWHAVTFWGWSKKLNQFTARQVVSGSGDWDWLFTSTGWDQDTLTWNQEPAPSQGRFVFSRKDTSFGYRFDMRRGDQWVTVDSLDCKPGSVK